MKKKPLSKSKENYIGPNCTFIAGQKTSNTGRTWKEIQERIDNNRRIILDRAGLELSLENMYGQGDVFSINESQQKLIRVYSTGDDLVKQKSFKNGK